MAATPKLEGSLVQRDFPELVQHLQERRWTGVLTLTREGLAKSVTVEDGRMVFAASSDPDERLGELLLRRGRLTLRQYVDAGKGIGPGKRLGTVLVEQGVLAPKDLVKAVVEHTQEIIYGAFQWTEGRYRLQEGQRPPEAITLNMSTPDLILEGIRRIESWSRIHRAAGGLEAQYARADGYEAIVARMTLSDPQLELVTALEGIQPLETICAGSRLSSVDVCRTLWALRVIGVLRRLDAPSLPSAPEDEGLGFVLAGE